MSEIPFYPDEAICKCESDACQRPCPYCTDTFCVHSDPCMVKAIDEVARMRAALERIYQSGEPMAAAIAEGIVAPKVVELSANVCKRCGLLLTHPDTRDASILCWCEDA